MSDISAYQHKFRAISNVTKPENVGKVRKRNRAVVSCQQCRNRKSKCDREHPCGTCKGHGTSCTYAKQNPKSSSKSSPQERLSHLENLLLEMMQSKGGQSQMQLPIGRSPTQLASPETSITSDDAEDAPSDLSHAPQGTYSKTDAGESYVGPTHWEAILETIHGLKFELESKGGPENAWANSVPKKPAQTETLFSTPRPPDLAYILRALPSRSDLDRKLSFYFNSKFFAVPIVHVNHFHRMYEKFWANPYEMSIMWISQLFSMLTISEMIQGNVNMNKEKSPQLVEEKSAIANRYATASAQCLVLADYTKPQRYLVEALFLYCQVKGMTSVDPAGETWLLYAIMTRQAIRLGYHKDPKHFPHISIFEGEMRRRAWFAIYQFDILTAFQLGLPCNLQVEDEWDTGLPRSIHDTDFDEDSTELPPARSEKEPTLMLYFLAKAAVMEVQKKLLHLQFSSKAISYENDILKLDAELHKLHDKTPMALRLKPMSQSFTDPAYLIMYRFQCNIVYQKALCVLHRTFLTGDQKRQYSIDQCTEAGMEMLRHQVTVFNESKPGGQLYQDQWFSMSLHMSNCFLAAVVLCQVVMTTNEEDCSQSKKDEIFSLLRTIYRITKEHKGESSEANRFHSALELILRKSDPTCIRNGNPYERVANPIAVPQVPAAAVPPPAPPMSMETLPIVDNFEGLFDGPESINWSLVDQGLMAPNQALADTIDWPEIDMNYLMNSDGSFMFNTQLENFQ